MNPDSEETPFDSQMNDDLHSRRAEPTHGPVRIGPSASPDNSPVATPSFAPAPATPLPPDTPPDMPDKEGVPTPVMIALAMALGAICVVGASIGMRHAIQPVKPIFPTVTALPPRGDVVMQDPDTVIKNPEPAAPSKSSTVPDERALSDATPSVEISELPPITAPSTTVKPRPSKPDSDSQASSDSSAPENTKTPDTFPPAETHRGGSFEITPPPGFRLRQSGRRTIWQRDDGAQILVETGKAGDGSPRAGWQKLDRDLARRYGQHYRSLGIHDGTLAGEPAAIWEFELTGKDGVTRRKIDVGTKINGRGYAVLGAAPSDKFENVRGEIEQALASFRVSTADASQPKDAQSSAPIPRFPRAAPTLAPDADRPLPQPEKTREPEKGY